MSTVGPTMNSDEPVASGWRGSKVAGGACPIYALTTSPSSSNQLSHPHLMHFTRIGSRAVGAT